MLLVVAVTLAASGYSLWVRRDTWRSRWEAGASLAIALEGCALVLMSPGTCLAIAIIAYASTRSWQAKVAWFTSGDKPPSQPVPPPSA